MQNRRRLIGWWLLALLGGTVLFTVAAVVSLGTGRPAVVQVVGDGDELWATTHERTFLQGVDVAWWVSRDGGTSWSAGTPGRHVSVAGPRQEACTAAACYRLVDGRRIERQASGAAGWQTEHLRPADQAPPPPGAYRSDWIEERSIAAVDGPVDAAVVATGHDGALVRDDVGVWRTVPVGHTWTHGYRWWVAGLGSAAMVIAGLLLLGIVLLTSRFDRRRRPPPPSSVPSAR